MGEIKTKLTFQWQKAMSGKSNANNNKICMQLMLPARQTQSFWVEKGAKFSIEEYFRGGENWENLVATFESA